MSLPRFPLFVAGTPGLEPVLLEEMQMHGWSAAKAVPGGVEISGTWPDVWRANLLLRGASRVLIRLGTFRVRDLGVLYGKTRELPWTNFLRHGQPFTVEATCRSSKIYHTGAAAERVAKAISAGVGADFVQGEGIRVFVRMENNLCTISVDSSGELLHRRGFKEDVGGAPLRETLAASFLRSCGYSGTEPVLDPFCGSGTIVTEAAEIAAGLAPGRARSFAFEDFPSFRADAYDRARKKALTSGETALRFRGSDRAAGAVKASVANAERAGIGHLVAFEKMPVSEVTRPEGPPGLILTNPPYGKRLSKKEDLPALYQAFGQVVRERFSGWRVGLVTAEESLAKTTRLALEPGPPVPHGSLKVRLWQGEA